MKYAHIETNGRLLGWYDSDIHNEIPTPNIQVTEEQWQQAINNNHNTINEDGSSSYTDTRTDEEKEAEAILSQISEAKQYLADTDYKVLPDYDGDATGILEARKEARATIRKIEGTV